MSGCRLGVDSVAAAPAQRRDQQLLADSAGPVDGRDTYDQGPVGGRDGQHLNGQRFRLPVHHGVRRHEQPARWLLVHRLRHLPSWTGELVSGRARLLRKPDQ